MQGVRSVRGTARVPARAANRGEIGRSLVRGRTTFLNPCGRLFSPRNAAQCLRLAMFFTPQYSDSYVEVGQSRGDEA